MVVAVMVLVNDRVPPTSGDEVAVYGVGHHERHRQREGQAAPEQEAAQSRLHRARHDEHYRVVNDLHDGYRERIRGEGQR